MKVHQEEPAFNPITITLESKDEQNKFLDMLEQVIQRSGSGVARDLAIDLHNRVLNPENEVINAAPYDPDQTVQTVEIFINGNSIRVNRALIPHCILVKLAKRYGPAAGGSFLVRVKQKGESKSEYIPETSSVEAKEGMIVDVWNNTEDYPEPSDVDYTT